MNCINAGGVNDCYWNTEGRCTSFEVTRNKRVGIWTRDWESKQNCTLTQMGVHMCSEYRPEGITKDEKPVDKQLLDEELASKVHYAQYLYYSQARNKHSGVWCLESLHELGFKKGEKYWVLGYGWMKLDRIERMLLTPNGVAVTYFFVTIPLEELRK
jgi:hypothetical protein